MNIFPDTGLFEGDRQDLEIILLIDISGSQDGWPLQKEKEISNSILSKLLPTDRLTILSFNNSITWAYSLNTIVEATVDNVLKGKTFINGLSSSGGTYLLDATKAVLAIPGTSEHKRIFIFLTDGFVGNEEEIFEAIANDPNNPTIFTFGAGNNLNKYFLEETAAIGNGYATEITENESIEQFVDAAWDKIETHQLKNITIDYGTSGANDLLMPKGTNLYIGSPLVAYGKYTNGGVQNIKIKGYVSGQPVEIVKTIDFASTPNMNFSIPLIWARQKIGMLLLEEGTTEMNKQQIIEISKEYQVLTKYTAFLAIKPEPAGENNSIQDEFEDSWNTALKLTLKQITKCFKIIISKGMLNIMLPEGVSIREFCVYDLRGRLTFHKIFEGRNISSFIWDGILENGKNIHSGSYIVRIKTDSGYISRPLNWVR